MSVACLKRLSRAAAVLVFVIAGALITGGPVSAHPELLEANPAPDALLAAPPQELEFWFSERVDTGAGSPTVEIVDEQGNRTATDAAVDPADPRHVTATTNAISSGTYTISWTVRSLDDGHALSGSYAFRVGGTDRAPGAATTEGERPKAWNVATRWLTFLGASLAAGSALLLVIGRYWPFSRPDDNDPESTPSIPDLRRPLAFAGALIATVATASEPFLQTLFPPVGANDPSLSDAFNGQPDAWLYRLIAVALALLLTGIALAFRRFDWASIAAGIAALAGVVGLSMTGHAAARDKWRTAAITVDAVHQITIVLWLGGLLLLALRWRSINRAMVGRFSTVALPLIVVGIGAGIGNSIFALPTLKSLWQSDYGIVILSKVIVLTFVLELATFHRFILYKAARQAMDVLARLRIPLRIEAILAIVIVLGGSILALLAPASNAEKPLLTALDLTNYSEPVAGQERLMTTLHLSPAKPGDNDVSVSIASRDGTPLPADQIQLVRFSFESLTSQTAQHDIDASPTATGAWSTDGMQLSIADWWRITVTIRQAGQQDTIVPFYLVLPDPNLNGFDAVPRQESDPDAKAVFDRGIASLTSLHRVTFIQQLTSGTGTVVLSKTSINDGADGSTPSLNTSTQTATVVTIGNQRWLGQTGGRWSQTPSNPPIPPTEWGQDYAAATDFRMGGIEEVNGEQAQLITFFVPETNIAPAYYTWWVGVDSGRLLQVAMVSRVHYMNEDYGNFDAEIVITPPVNPEGTPLAEPGLDIENMPG